MGFQTNKTKNPVLSDTETRHKLKELHKSYVVVPTDKAANNVSIIYKKYYQYRDFMNVLQNSHNY